MKDFCKIHGPLAQISYIRAQKVTRSPYFEALSHYIVVITEDPVVLLAHYLTQIISPLTSWELLPPLRGLVSPQTELNWKYGDFSSSAF